MLALALMAGKIVARLLRMAGAPHPHLHHTRVEPCRGLGHHLFQRHGERGRPNRYSRPKRRPRGSRQDLRADPDLFFGAHQRMDFHLLEFSRSEFAGLGEDACGPIPLSDLVPERGGCERLELCQAEMQLLSDLGGLYLHAA
jgi:hypothetical protein